MGFLPDGRLTALKAVRRDYTDWYSGRVFNGAGTTISWPRDNRSEPVDETAECSHLGFHVGVYDYVKDFCPHDGHIMLVAFWPHDVIAVASYEGGRKMRVWEYEVLEELDRDKLLEFIEANGDLVLRSNTPAMPEDEEDSLHAYDFSGFGEDEGPMLEDEEDEVGYHTQPPEVPNYEPITITIPLSEVERGVDEAVFDDLIQYDRDTTLADLDLITSRHSLRKFERRLVSRFKLGYVKLAEDDTFETIVETIRNATGLT
jgi:hypothetical protein